MRGRRSFFALKIIVKDVFKNTTPTGNEHRVCIAKPSRRRCVRLARGSAVPPETPSKRTKGILEAMRKRATHINIRTTPDEKSRIENHAKKCGLILSEYLRKLANDYEPKPLPPLDYRALMKQITDLYTDFNEWGETGYADILVVVLQEMLAAISPQKSGGKSGNN